MTLSLSFILVIIINIVTIVSAFFIIKYFGFTVDKLRTLRSNLKKTGMILEGTSFFGYPDKDTPINKNFAYVLSYGYVMWPVGGFIFIFGLILFDLILTLGFIIVILQSL